MNGCKGAGTKVLRPVLPQQSLGTQGSILLLLLGCLSHTVWAQPEPYRYYGGEIETEAKNTAIEACEYRLLVEEQRCNRRANKTACIKEVHKECREEYRDKAFKEPDKEGN